MTDLERGRVRSHLRSALFGAQVEPVRVGRYEILQYIGRGGMSMVYCALDPRLGRRVALKVVPVTKPSEASRTAYDQRLMREGEALASVSHPNVVGVYDMGVSDNHAYLALELVDGESLQEWMTRAKPSWRAVLDVMLLVADGLAAAHAADLVHRDITPRNIVIDSRGNPRVIDFGLVRAQGAQDVESANPCQRPTHLTQTGVTLGTPLYMAPEQWLSETIDSCTDQFGFCATLFEALHGRPPFPSTDLEQLRTAITSGQLVGVSDGSDVPDWLDSLIRRGLAIAPQARHDSMSSLAAAIRGHLAGIDESKHAQGLLGQLRVLLVNADSDIAEIDRIGLEARSTFDTALHHWPGNTSTKAGRNEVLRLLIHHEIRRNNADVASRLLSDLDAPDKTLIASVEEARERESDVASRLQILADIEYNANTNVANRWKQALQGLGLVASGIVFLLFGYLNRTGVYEVGTIDVTIFYLGFFLIHAASYLVLAEVYNANTVTRNAYNFGLASLAGHTLMMFVCHLLEVEMAITFVVAHTMACALWAVSASTTDPRHAIAIPGIFLSMVGTMIWPTLCFEFASAAYFIGIGPVALFLPKEQIGQEQDLGSDATR